MNKKNLVFGIMGGLVLAGTCLEAADARLYISKPGSKIRMEGTSSVHDWQAETPFIGGQIEAGADFPQELGQAWPECLHRSVAAHREVRIPTSTKATRFTPLQAITRFLPSTVFIMFRTTPPPDGIGQV